MVFHRGEELSDLILQLCECGLFERKVRPVGQFDEVLAAINPFKGVEAQLCRGPVIGTGMNQEQGTAKRQLLHLPRMQRAKETQADLESAQ